MIEVCSPDEHEAGSVSDGVSKCLSPASSPVDTESCETDTTMLPVEMENSQHVAQYDESAPGENLADAELVQVVQVIFCLDCSIFTFVRTKLTRRLNFRAYVVISVMQAIPSTLVESCDVSLRCSVIRSQREVHS